MEVNYATMVFMTCIAVLVSFAMRKQLNWRMFWKIMLMNNNEICHEGIKTLMVRNESECVLAIKQLLAYSPQIVGFDLEWKSSKNQHLCDSKVSLMQIAFSDKLIILIRVHLLQRIPMELIAFLHNVTILKCGVGIYGDRRKLYKDYNIDMFGCVELNDIYLNIHPTHDTYFGLERFSNCLLNKEMKYKHDMNHTQWECAKLCKTQIDYAANDALIGYEIFVSIFNTSDEEHILQFCFGKIDTNLLSKKAFSKMNKKKKAHKKKRRKMMLIAKNVECICNNKMVIVTAADCIKNTECRVQNTSQYIVCNRCYQEQKEEFVKVYQCTERKSIFCEKGYFLCISCSVKPKDAHYEYKIMDKEGDLLHCCSLRMFTLFRASKNWVQRLNRYTIKMKVTVNAIHVDHFGDTYFRHIAWMNTKCYVCNNDENEVFPFKIIPKWFVENVLGYRVPLCAGCRSKYSKQVSLWCHEFCEKYLMKNDEKYKLIYETKKVKKYCECLQYKHRRKQLHVCIQNEYISKIFEFYYQHYQDNECVEMKDVMIKECEFNMEIGIDWYLNKKSYKTIVIRNVLHTICRTFCRRKHDDYMKQILNKHFAQNVLQFAEWLRERFMKYMKPQNYNRKYTAFEVMYVGDEGDELFDPHDEKFKSIYNKSQFVVLEDETRT